MTDLFEGIISRDRCDWHACPNTAVRAVTLELKVRGEHTLQVVTANLCRPHDEQARRTGRVTLRDRPERLGALDFGS